MQCGQSVCLRFQSLRDSVLSFLLSLLSAVFRIQFSICKWASAEHLYLLRYYFKYPHWAEAKRPRSADNANCLFNIVYENREGGRERECVCGDVRWPSDGCNYDFPPRWMWLINVECGKKTIDVDASVIYVKRSSRDNCRTNVVCSVIT